MPTDNKFQHSIKLWPSQDNTVASKAELDPSEPLKSMDLEWCWFCLVWHCVEWGSADWNGLHWWGHWGHNQWSVPSGSVLPYLVKGALTSKSWLSTGLESCCSTEDQYGYLPETINISSLHSCNNSVVPCWRIFPQLMCHQMDVFCVLPTFPPFKLTAFSFSDFFSYKLVGWVIIF